MGKVEAADEIVARYDEPCRIDAYDAIEIELTQRRILAPAVPQSHAGEEEEDVNTEITHSHKSVPRAATRHTHVEKHHDENGKSHQLTPVSRYLS
jgi:hypothetical protein